MKDEILPGYSISEFLRSTVSNRWDPSTRHGYSNCLQDLLAFAQQNGTPTPQLLAAWQAHLRQTYGRTALNVHIAAANNYFRWCERPDLISAHTKPGAEPAQHPPALTRAEYLKLLRTARSLEKHRSYLLVKLFATVDLPLQCLDQVTAELVRQGHGELNYRGSPLAFRCPPVLQKELLAYMAQNGIYRGPVFCTRSGQPLNRVNIFRSMQQLCQAAGIPEEKGNPRSLRNLYKVTQKRMDDRLALLRQQMYDEMLEIEQDDIGWRAEPNTSRGCSA